MPSETLDILRVRDASKQVVVDSVAIEEPLEIRVAFGPRDKRERKSLSITMRTPGHDFELATGFLFTEGIVRSRPEIEDVVFCGPSKNVVRVELSPEASFDFANVTRHFYTTSSCGVCGKSSIDALRSVRPEACEDGFSDSAKQISAELLYRLPEKLKEAQKIFAETGGLHASALFDLQGQLLLLREDVGRHNALDKLIGSFVLAGSMELGRHILLLSGRASFELIQKAAVAGIRTVAAVGAPSSLAIELAREMNMTLCGFLRDRRFNIYTGEARVSL